MDSVALSGGPIHLGLDVSKNKIAMGILRWDKQVPDTEMLINDEPSVRGFYDFHLEAGSGPMVNPFPLVRRGGRVNAHHNPMEPFVGGRTGRYRPRPSLSSACRGRSRRTVRQAVRAAGR